MHGGPTHYWYVVVVCSVHKFSHHASSAHKFKKKKSSSLSVPSRSEEVLWNREESSVPVALADYSEFTSTNYIIILGLSNSVPIMNSSVSKIDGSLIKCSRHMPIYSRIHTECSVLKNHSFPRVSNCYFLSCLFSDWVRGKHLCPLNNIARNCPSTPMSSENG